MKQATINYYGNTTYTLSYPENWAEVNNKQFRQFFRWHNRYPRLPFALMALFLFSPKIPLRQWFKMLAMERRIYKVLPDIKFWYYLAIPFTNYRKRWFSRVVDNFIAYGQEDVLLEPLHFVADRNQLKHEKSRMKWIGLFLGPGDLLMNLSAQQFAVIERELQDYDRKKTTKNLYRLMGAMYQPIFIPFFKTVFYGRISLEPLYTLMVRIFIRKSTAKMAILNYQGLLRQFSTYFKVSFTPGGKKSKLPNYGVEGLIIQRSGDKFGHYQLTGRTPLFIFFMALEQANAQHKEQLAAMEAMKQKKH